MTTRARFLLPTLLALFILLTSGAPIPAWGTSALSAQGALGDDPEMAARTVPGADGRIPQLYAALVNAHVLDVRTGEVLREATVVVRDGVIESVGTGAPPAGALRIDLGGKYLVPGFMDSHWHGQTLQNARRALESGVTTVRSAGAGGTDFAMRALVRDGRMAGPEVLAVGVYVNRGIGLPAWDDPRLLELFNQEIRGEDLLRQLVRINLDRGADWIKTRTGGSTSSPGGPDPKRVVYDLDEVRAIVDESAAGGAPVACHAHGAHVIRIAIEGGCRTVEHGSYITEELLRLMLERGTVWNPTYSSVEGFLLPHDDYNSSAARLRGPYILANMREMLRVGHDLGVPIIPSTDTQYGPRSAVRLSTEITNFVEHAGMTPLEALQSATIVSAEVLGLADRTGAVEAGLEADLVAFDQNPLEEITVVQDPLFVMSNGRLVHHRTVTGAGYVAPRVDLTGFGVGGPVP